jgi:hypothetical protein
VEAHIVRLDDDILNRDLLVAFRLSIRRQLRRVYAQNFFPVNFDLVYLAALPPRLRRSRSDE